MRVKLEDDDGAEVQMAPLIDCMFLLLIFFLVATTLKETQKELPIELPVADAAIEAPIEPEVCVLGVDHAGAFYLNGEPATTEMLFAAVHKAARTEKLVQIDGDRTSEYQKIIELIAMCRIEGIDDVKLKIRKEQ